MRANRSTLGPVIALLLVLLAACGRREGAATGATPSPSAAAEFPVTLTDDEGVRITVEAPPERIVTFAPSHTEIVFALGLGDRLVGVSGPFDDHPPQAEAIEEIGGAGEFGADPNVEKVVALEPDLFLAISGGEGWKAQLRELEVPVVTLDATDLADLLDDIATVGRLTGAAAAAAALIADMRADADAVAEAVAAEAQVPCFFESYYPPLYSVGPGSFIYDLLLRAGCDPVTADATTPYPEWSLEDLVAEDPDVYLVSSESGVSPRQVAGRPGFSALEAVQEGRVVLIDSDLVARPGPRVVEGLEALAGALHPAVVG